MMLNNKIFRIGVLGNAAIAERLVIPAIQNIYCFELAGVASRSIQTAELMSRKYVTPVYFGYEKIIADDSIDAIYIPLPNSLHFPFAEMALLAGKHVLVEKPLCYDSANADRLVSLAREKSLALLENFQFRFHSQLSAISDLVISGRIGELRLVRVAFGFPPFPSRDNIRYSSALGGGAFLDAGVYSLKLAPYFLGHEPRMVHSNSVSPQIGDVDLSGSGTLESKDGSLTCQFAYGFDHFYKCRLELWGSLGTISTDRIFTAPSNYHPKLTIECRDITESHTLAADDHFRNILLYFHSLIVGSRDREIEYLGNLEQAKLVHCFREALGQTL